MSFGVTPSGFVAKRFEDIVSDISTQINNTFNINIDSDPDNKIKTLVNIMTLPLAENWEVCQSLSAQMDIDQAEDVFLDYLCAGKLIYRQTSVKSSGDVSVEIGYNDELTLPIQSSFYNKNNKEFQTTTKLELSQTNIHKAKIAFDNTTADANITVVLNGATFTQSIGGDYDSALSSLITTVMNAGYYVTPVGDYIYEIYLIEEPKGEDITFSVTLTEGVDDENSSIFRSVAVEYTEDGDFVFPANTLTVAPSFSAILSFSNTDIVGGRFRESDEELRFRFKSSPSVVGKATPLAIKSSILDISGVTDVSVIINNTMTTFAEGNPPKSIEVVVKGGEDEEVASKLYEYHGAGIQLYGNTSTIVTDVNEEPFAVEYSRIESLYTHLRISYKKYDEEEFPDDGNTVIRDSVVSYVNNLNIGNDVIGGRVASTIYRNVAGIEDITVEMFGTTDFNGTGTYTTQPVRVSRKQEAITDINRVIIQEV